MQLSTNWFTEGSVDFELQKYRLLAYLREVNACFGQSKLYPQLSDLIFHYNNLLSFRDSKRVLQEQFPRRVRKIDLRRVAVIYERMLADDDLMSELDDITRYAIESLKDTIDTGARLYELVEQQLEIAPVGILPLYKNEGYVLLRQGHFTETRAYAYRIALYEQARAPYRNLRLTYVQSWPRNFMHTYQYIKKELLRFGSVLVNPAFYCVETNLQLPLDETILPVARRVLVRYLAA